MPTNDVVDETNETITVSGTSGTLTVNSATITLTDDDAAPTAITADRGRRRRGRGRRRHHHHGDGHRGRDDPVRHGHDGDRERRRERDANGSGTSRRCRISTSRSPPGRRARTTPSPLTPTNDAVDETDETVTVSGMSGSLTVNSATINLTDRRRRADLDHAHGGRRRRGRGRRRCHHHGDRLRERRHGVHPALGPSASAWPAAARSRRWTSRRCRRSTSCSCWGAERERGLHVDADRRYGGRGGRDHHGESARRGSLPVNSARISLTDDDGVPTSLTLTVDDDTVGEGDGPATIRVTATLNGTGRFGEAKTVRCARVGKWHRDRGGFPRRCQSFDITINASADERRRHLHPDADRRRGGRDQRGPSR